MRRRVDRGDAMTAIPPLHATWRSPAKVNLCLRVVGRGNAASVLRELNVRLRLGVTEVRLRQLAVALGADVPFFLAAAPARVRGIGSSRPARRRARRCS